MIIFDQLRISDGGDKMYINAHVNEAEYFDNIYIESVTIMTSDKVSETSSSTPNSDYIYTKTIEGDTKELNLVLTVFDFVKTWETDPKAMAFKQSEMSTTLFFVYIKCKGTVDANVPCTLDENIVLGVVFDETMFYQKVMNHTKDLLATCCVPKLFIDFILLWNAFKASVETEHYISAIKFYNLLFDVRDSKSYIETIKGCGCHG